MSRSIKARRHYLRGNLFSYRRNLHFANKTTGKWLSKIPIFARIDDLIRSLGPYTTFALFAVPLVVLEPIKPVGLYLIA